MTDENREMFKLGPRSEMEDTSLIDTPERRQDRMRWLQQLVENRGFANPDDASRKASWDPIRTPEGVKRHPRRGQ